MEYSCSCCVNCSIIVWDIFHRIISTGLYKIVWKSENAQIIFKRATFFPSVCSYNKSHNVFLNILPGYLPLDWGSREGDRFLLVCSAFISSSISNSSAINAS